MSKTPLINSAMKAKTAQPLLEKTSAKPARGKVIWLLLKYQIVTKTLLYIALVPGFTALVRLLILSTGRTAITSGDYWPFLLSAQGAGMLLLAILLLMVTVGLDINAFVVMTALIYEGKTELTVRRMLLVGLKSLKLLIRPSGLVIVFYVSLVLPLLGLGIFITPTQGLQIPNFVTEVIYDSPLYLGLYVTALIGLLVLGLRHIFALHYMMILGQDTFTAFRSSAQLLKGRKWQFFKDFVIKGIFKAGLRLIAVFALAGAVLVPIFFLGVGGVIGRRFLIGMGILLTLEVMSLLVLLLTPLIINLLTTLFYQYNQADGRTVRLFSEMEQFKSQRQARQFSTKLAVSAVLIIVMTVNMAVAGVLAFDANLGNNRPAVDIIAHRGGGDLGVENSIDSLRRVIATGGVKWSEIDVQRTQDGHYILNHDMTFKRLAGEARSAQQMTLAEIKQLSLRNHFRPDQPAQPVATIEEALDVAKDKIGLFVELKGRSADRQMADDLVRMIKQRQMVKQTVLLSMKYSLIKYIEERYPEIQTGYLYYFAVGGTADLVGDYLIMEELQATPSKVAEIQAKGKKAIVWTVNRPASIDHFLRSRVDGVITDHVERVKRYLQDYQKRSEFEKIAEQLIND